MLAFAKASAVRVRHLRAVADETRRISEVNRRAESSGIDFGEAFRVKRRRNSLIRFPKSLWQAIDADAQRCRRSSVKQMEAVLSAYYELGDVEINRENLQMVGELMPTSKTKMPVVEAKIIQRKKKKKRTA